MSQQPSSSEYDIPDVASEREMRTHLDRYLGQTMRPGFFGRLALRLQDPFTDKNGFRLNPFWICCAVLLGLIVAVFLYFNFVRS